MRNDLFDEVANLSGEKFQGMDGEIEAVVGVAAAGDSENTPAADVVAAGPSASALAGVARADSNLNADNPGAAAAEIRILPGGPYEVRGVGELFEAAIVPSDDGTHLIYKWVRDFEIPTAASGQPAHYHLCRCGASGKKPFCDGSHSRVHFGGAETAARTTYKARAKKYSGPELVLFDDDRCAFARLCHYAGQDVWSLTVGTPEQTGLTAAEQRRRAVASSSMCPTGRLVHVDGETGRALEVKFAPSIGVLEDVQAGASGPLFVRGGVALVGADGRRYEVRNRYALCRCGAAANKPFCDATHIAAAFNDGAFEA